MTLYKALGHGAESIFGGHAAWNLPVGGGPGAWMPPAARRSPGAAGYHLAGAGDVLRYWLAPRLFIVEGRGASVVTPAGSAVVFQEARLVRELSWNCGIALRLYRECLEFAVAEAQLHGDFVDEARHQCILADARSWPADGRWYDAIRQELSCLATATGGIWHRAERRRRDPALHPLRSHVERVRDWQARRLLDHLLAQVPSANDCTHA